MHGSRNVSKGGLVELLNQRLLMMVVRALSKNSISLIEQNKGQIESFPFLKTLKPSVSTVNEKLSPLRRNDLKDFS